MPRTFELKPLLTEEELKGFSDSFAASTGFACNITVQPPASVVARILEHEKLLTTDYEANRSVIEALDSELNGQSLDLSANRSEFCEQIRLQPLGRMRCLYSDLSHAETARRNQTAECYHCHAGLVDIVAPLRVGDYHVANLFLGQIREMHAESLPKLPGIETTWSVHEKQQASTSWGRLGERDGSALKNIQSFLIHLANLISASATSRASRIVFGELWRSIRSGKNSQLVFEELLRTVQQLSDFDYASIWLVDPRRPAQLEYKFGIWPTATPGHAPLPGVNPPDPAIATRVLETGNTLVLKDATALADAHPHFSVPSHASLVKSAAIIPLQQRYQPLGVLELYANRERVFWEDTARLIQDTVSPVAIVISSNEEVPRLLSQVLTGESNSETLTRLVANTVPTLLRAACCSIFMKEHEDSSSARCVATTGFFKIPRESEGDVRCQLGRGLTGLVLEKGTEIQLDRLEDAKTSSDLAGVDIQDELDSRERLLGLDDMAQGSVNLEKLAFMAVPVKRIGVAKPIGVIRVYGFAPFGILEHSLLASLADTFATPRLDRGRLLDILAACSTLQDSPTKALCCYRFLTTVTHGQAIAVNRAILLSYDITTGSIYYETAIGPGSEPEKVAMSHAASTVPPLAHCLEHFEEATRHIKNCAIHRTLNSRRFALKEALTEEGHRIIADTGGVRLQERKIDDLFAGELKSALGTLGVSAPTIVSIGTMPGEGFWLLCDNPFWNRDPAATSRTLLTFACAQFAKAVIALSRGEQQKRDRLRTVQNIAAVASHTLGNTIAPARAFIQSLAKEIGDPVLRKKVEQARNLLDSAARSLRAFRQFYKRARPREELTVAQLLEDIERHLGYEPQVHVRRGGPLHERTRASSDLLCSCFDVLVENSQTHSGKGSDELRMHVFCALPGEEVQEGRKVPEDDKVPRDQYLALVYVDNGRGVREEYKKWISEPAFSTKDGVGGTGLAYVSAVLDVHEGFLVESGVPGQGAMFSMFLPRTGG
jgi:Signal transduction histidine kinase